MKLMAGGGAVCAMAWPCAVAISKAEAKAIVVGLKSMVFTVRRSAVDGIGGYEIGLYYQRP